MKPFVKHYLLEDPFVFNVVFVTDCDFKNIPVHIAKYLPSTNAKEFIDSYKKIPEGIHITAYQKNGSMANIIWVRRSSNTVALVHEITHLVIDTLEYRGVPLTAENSEVVASCVSCWCDRIAHALKRKKK